MIAMLLYEKILLPLNTRDYMIANCSIINNSICNVPVKLVGVANSIHTQCTCNMYDSLIANPKTTTDISVVSIVPLKI